jgi:hypothetical protein
MPKRKSLVTGLLAQPGQSSKPRKAGKPEASPARRRVIKTVRVDPEAWDTFRRYALRRQGRGEVVDMGLLVETAIGEYQAKHPA